MNDNRNQYTQHYMINFDQAIDLIDNHVSKVNTINIPLEQSLGLVVSSTIISPESVPPFNNSAMDGYAVMAEDLITATSATPAVVQLTGITAAGESPIQVSNRSGTAIKIMTGAPVPEGYDAIIPVENTRLEGDRVYCFSSPTQYDHIRKIGEDFQLGESISQPGKIVDANLIAACATLGISELPVYRPINITLFSTGKELVDDLKQPLLPGQIRNSNKPFIQQWLNHLPIKLEDGGTNFDEPEKFEQSLSNALAQDVDIIISSGAVSMGDFDFIPSTIIKLGGTIIFHKLKIRPGKPILFAKFPNGSFYFGLPGNPISAAIGLRFLVSHLIRKMYQLPRELGVAALSTSQLNKKAGFRTIWKANQWIDHEAMSRCEVLDGQESFKIKPLLSANGWVLVDESKEQLNCGDRVIFYPKYLPWLS